MLPHQPWRWPMDRRADGVERCRPDQPGPLPGCSLAGGMTDARRTAAGVASVWSWLPRMLRIAGGMLTAGTVAACTSATPPPSSPGRDFAQYRTLRHYRAFAGTGGAGRR